MTGVATLLLLALEVAQGSQAQCKEPERPPAGTALIMVLKLAVTVLDSESAPVQFGTVRFQDAAPPVSERDPGRIVGFTGADGRLITGVTYEWEDYFSETARPDSGAFDILIHAPNGEDVVRHFVIECVPRIEKAYAVTIQVALARTRDSMILY